MWMWLTVAHLVTAEPSQFLVPDNFKGVIPQATASYKPVPVRPVVPQQTFQYQQQQQIFSTGVSPPKLVISPPVTAPPPPPLRQVVRTPSPKIATPAVPLRYVPPVVQTTRRPPAPPPYQPYQQNTLVQSTPVKPGVPAVPTYSVQTGRVPALAPVSTPAPSYLPPEPSRPPPPPPPPESPIEVIYVASNYVSL